MSLMAESLVYREHIYQPLTHAITLLSRRVVAMASGDDSKSSEMWCKFVASTDGGDRDRV